MPTISFTVDATAAARLAHAIGIDLGLNRDATATEVRQFIVDKLKALVRSIERKEAEAAVPPPSDLVVS